VTIKRLCRSFRDAAYTAWLTLRTPRGRLWQRVGRIPVNIRRCRQGRFAPVEAFRLGMLDGGRIVPWSVSVSRKNTTKLQKALNPAETRRSFTNKWEFFLQTREAGLPTVPVIAFYDAVSGSFSLPNRRQMAAGAGVQHLEAVLPEAFVIKRVNGAFGHGLRVVLRDADGYTDTSGRRFTLEDLLEESATESPEGVLFQPRLTNHQGMVELTGVGGRQTCRVITLADTDGQVRILHAHLNIICRSSQMTDNFIDGWKGNVEAPIDLATGALAQANFLCDSGCGPTIVDPHPVSGRRLAGAMLPLWSATCDLAHQAARFALPARAIGWDLAITNAGPVVVEGNVFWHPPNQHGVMASIADELRRATAQA
jgi:hypothetical protein